MKILKQKPEIKKVEMSDLTQISGCTWHCGDSPAEPTYL